MGDSVRPSGVVTFLFTDIEGSTRLWETDPDGMREALAVHDDVLRMAIEGNGGWLFKHTGDGVCASFASPGDAVGAAISSQRDLGLPVRMGIATGEADLRGDDYFGPALNRAARIMDAGHGGQVLVGATAAGLAQRGAVDHVELTELGEHRLRDLGQPETLFQICHPDLQRSFPALRTIDSLPGNLPLQLTSFVGREQELENLTDMLAKSRLVTLTGVGGVGKTRLAIQVAADLLLRFEEGAWLCELATASDDVLMFQTIADALGVFQREGLSMAESIVVFLRDRERLIVLDNCEHLLTDAAWLAEEILGRCPRVRLLATSREGLGVPGEHLVALPSLTVPRADVDADLLADSDAVRLFGDRAAAVRSGFEVDSGNLESVVEICRRLDGMPLAIELAAARVTALSPAEIATRLDERFRLLTGGRRNRVERHQTLRSTVEWSYSLLEPIDRTVFDRLGVFVGGFDAAAAEAVASDEEIGSWDVLDALADLVEKSMVTAEDVSDGTTRYRMLETLRAFAREQLDAAGMTDDLRRRHASYYTALCENVGPELLGPDEDAAIRHIVTEIENVWALLRWGCDAPDQSDADLAIRALAVILVVQVAFGTDKWADPLLDRCRSSTLPQALKVIGAAGAWHATFLDDPERGQLLAREALASPLAAHDAEALVTAYATLSGARFRQGEPGEALELVKEGLHALDGAGGSARHRFQLSTHSTLFHLSVGDVEAAQTETAAALEGARAVGSRRLLGLALQFEGRAWFADDPERALEAIEQGLALSPDDFISKDIGLGGAAQLRARMGDRVAALTHLQSAFAHDHEIGMRAGIGYTVERAIAVFSSLRDDELAAICAGIVQAHVVTSVRTIPQVDQTAERVAARLGPDAYQAAFERGAALAYEKVAPILIAAIENLLATEAGPTKEPVPTEGIQLTERQFQVARLVARGLSNKDIAEKLGLSPYTVETHVRNILERLDATNRTQIVAWVLANQRE